MAEEETHRQMQDPTLAMTLRHAIAANCQIDGLHEKMIVSLETQQERYMEETERIKELEKQLPRTKNADRQKMNQTRLNAAYKKRKMAEQQIVHLRGQIQQLLERSQDFKDRYEELLAGALAQKNKEVWEKANKRIQNIDAEEMADMEADLNQQMERLAQIENADYSISADAVAELQSEEAKMIFSTLDRQLGQYPQALKEGEFPDYYPSAGISLENL